MPEVKGTIDNIGIKHHTRMRDGRDLYLETGNRMNGTPVHRVTVHHPDGSPSWIDGWTMNLAEADRRYKNMAHMGVTRHNTERQAPKPIERPKAPPKPTGWGRF